MQTQQQTKNKIGTVKWKSCVLPRKIALADTKLNHVYF